MNYTCSSIFLWELSLNFRYSKFFNNDPQNGVFSPLKTKKHAIVYVVTTLTFDLFYLLSWFCLFVLKFVRASFNSSIRWKMRKLLFAYVHPLAHCIGVPSILMLAQIMSIWRCIFTHLPSLLNKTPGTMNILVSPFFLVLFTFSPYP